MSDDGLVGSTNTSGASIDPMMQRSEVIVAANDFPYGLLQFGNEVGVPPSPGDGGMILPATEVPTVSLIKCRLSPLRFLGQIHLNVTMLLLLFCLFFFSLSS